MKIWTCLALLICSAAVYAQQKDDYKQMIDSAINIKYSKYKTASTNQNAKQYLENLYLINEQDRELDYLPCSNKFKQINIYDTKNRHLISKGIYAWKVIPKLNGTKLIVNIIDFYITFKKNNYNYGNDGGAQIIFDYDSGKNIWRLVSDSIKGN